MAPAFGRLLPFARRRSRPDRSTVDGPLADGGSKGLEGETWGPPPVLLPAAIVRELLYDPTEFTPAWLRPRPAPEPDPATSSAATVDETAVAKAATTGELKPMKRKRQPKANGSPGATKTRSRRVVKPDHDVAGG
jgi:hypothetical protein